MSEQEEIRVLTVGTGAVGAIYSWRLAQSCKVTAVCRSNYEVVKRNGFQIDSVKFGQGTFRPHHVVRHVSEANEHGPFDFVMVTLKALPDVYNVGEIIAPAVTEGRTAIVLVQNGFGIEEPIVQRFPKNPLISVVAYIGTSQIAPGRIKMAAVEYLRVGTYKGCLVNSEPACTKFKECLEKGDVQVDPVDDIEVARWEKLIWNASFSPICAFLRLNTTQVIENEAALDLVKRLMREIMAAATAATGQQFEVEELIEGQINGTRVGAANYRPSMQLDLERGQPMEVEVILGTALRSAKQHDVPTPTLETVYEMCKAMNIHHLKAQL